MSLSATLPSKTSDRLRLLGAAALFSTGGAAVKASAFNGWQVACLRSGIAALALFLFVKSTRRRWDGATIAISAVYAVTMVLFVIANKTTTAANAIFLQSAAPLYLLVLSPLILKERVTRPDLVAMGIIAVGLGLVMWGSPPATTMAPNPFLGNTLAVISGMALAVTTIGLRWLASRPDGAGRQGAVLVCGNVIACLMCIGPALPIGGIGPVDWGMITYLGVFQIGLAYLLVTQGLRGVPAVEASLLMLVEPALNPIWVWLIHGEQPGTLPIIGGALILTASIIRANAKS